MRMSFPGFTPHALRRWQQLGHLSPSPDPRGRGKQLGPPTALTAAQPPVLLHLRPKLSERAFPDPGSKGGGGTCLPFTLVAVERPWFFPSPHPSHLP